MKKSLSFSSMVPIKRMFTSPHHPPTGTSSYVNRGKDYEYICQQALQHIGINTVVVGGRGDNGVDLRGRWSFDGGENNKKDMDRGSGKACPVFVQCKFINRQLAPSIVRELEGAIGGRGAIGAIACNQAASASALQTIRLSKCALLYLRVIEEEGEGVITNAFANRSVYSLFPGLVIGTSGLEKRPTFYFSN